MAQSFIFKKEDNASLREKVYRSIRGAIIKGELKAGERLLEVAIAEQMGTSRGPIREALRQLEHEGLVNSSTYRETVVAEVSEEEVSNILVPIRLIVESYAASKASELFSMNDYQQLHRIVINMSEAISDDNLVAFSEYDLQFHEYILKKPGIPSLLKIWQSIVGKIYLRVFTQGYQNTNLSLVVKEHLEFIELIKEGNTEKINQHLTTHIF